MTKCPFNLPGCMHGPAKEIRMKRDDGMVDDDIVGRRVRLIRCNDPYTRLQPGSEGTVLCVDDIGTVFVDWDGGSKLGLVPGEDLWLVLP